MSNLLALQDELDQRRASLDSVRQAIKAHCRAIDLLKQIERDEMWLIRAIEEMLPAETEGAAVIRGALAGQPVEWVQEVVG